jgi:hypothetical protein
MMKFCYKYKFHTTRRFISKTYSSTLRIEATCSPETSVDFQRTTRRYIPEDRTLHNHRCENLKSYINLKSLWKRTGLLWSLNLRFSWRCLWREATSCLPPLSADFLLGLLFNQYLEVICSSETSESLWTKRRYNSGDPPLCTLVVPPPLRKHFISFIIIIYLTANVFLAGGSGNTIRHNTENNPPRSNKAQHTKLHNRKCHILYYTQWIPLLKFALVCVCLSARALICITNNNCRCLVCIFHFIYAFFSYKPLAALVKISRNIGWEPLVWVDNL